MFAQDVRELEVYKLAFSIQQQIFHISKAFPKEEMYSLTDQIRRSSRSVGANLSEAWGKRRYPANFISKLIDATSETEETIHWLETALACKYIPQETMLSLKNQCGHILGMLNKMITLASTWSNRT